MSTSISAGLLMYRHAAGGLQVFLVHPGGPYFRGKDYGAWSIPKGQAGEGEDLLEAARREFHEETGIKPGGRFIPLGSIRQAGGKRVQAWAFAGEWEPADGIHSNEFELEWPPKSGRRQMFPEIDRAGFFSLKEARRKMNPAQTELLDRLLECLEGTAADECPPEQHDGGG